MLKDWAVTEAIQSSGESLSRQFKAMVQRYSKSGRRAACDIWKVPQPPDTKH